MQNQFDTRILNLEHTVYVTAVFSYSEINDDDPINGVRCFLVGVNYMLDTYPFRKHDLEHSVDAHPFETNMTLQD